MNLKPCPFCGGEAVIHQRAYITGVRYAVCECRKCHARTDEIMSDVSYCANDKAQEAWNRRAEE